MNQTTKSTCSTENPEGAPDTLWITQFSGLEVQAAFEHKPSNFRVFDCVVEQLVQLLGNKELLQSLCNTVISAACKTIQTKVSSGGIGQWLTQKREP